MSHCQICLHPSPNHEENCPVGTGEAVAGIGWLQQEALMQNQLQNQLGQYDFETDQKIAEELKSRRNWRMPPVSK